MLRSLSGLKTALAACLDIYCLCSHDMCKRGADAMHCKHAEAFSSHQSLLCMADMARYECLQYVLQQCGLMCEVKRVAAAMAMQPCSLICEVGLECTLRPS